MSGSMASKSAFSPASSARPTPVSSPAPQFADSEKERTVKPMSKEEKAAEMARRKEERRLVCTYSTIPSASTRDITHIAYRETEGTEEECRCCCGVTSLTMTITNVYAFVCTCEQHVLVCTCKMKMRANGTQPCIFTERMSWVCQCQEIHENHDRTISLLGADN